MKTINKLLYLTSSFALLAFIGLFLNHNKAGLTNFYLIVMLAVLYFALFSYTAYKGFKDDSAFSWLSSPFSQRLSAIVALFLLITITLDNLIFDYYQAITTSDTVIYAWLVSWSTIIIMLVLAFIRSFIDSSAKQKSTFQHSVTFAFVALIGVPVMWFTGMITSPQPNEKLSLHSDIFVGGIDGYQVYRIPALLVIPKNSTLANGRVLATDRIIVMAEARRDGALDTGVIDLVQKISDDGGESWSKQHLICQYKEQSMHGKCGNATPVFDKVTGQLFLAYNLSGIPINAPEGSRPHKSLIMTSIDGGLSYAEGKVLAMPNSVFGPGHGIQKQLAPHKNRLVIPYNTSVGGQGSSIALYSDDHGKTWLVGNKLGTGNENEIAELSNGDLMMATRHIAPVGRPPEANGRLFSTSTDAGDNWLEPILQAKLITPICQASLLSLTDNNGDYSALAFLNPANKGARVQLTLRTSKDDGKEWNDGLLIYPGPSGYSQLGQLTDKSIVMLYENGKLSYSEKISFAKLALSILGN